MNAIFNLCVDILMWLASLLGLTYVEVNVWIFCVIWPIITVGLIAAVYIEAIRISVLKEQIREMKKQMSL